MNDTHKPLVSIVACAAWGIGCGILLAPAIGLAGACAVSMIGAFGIAMFISKL